MKRGLQIVVGLLSLLPLSFGVLGLLSGVGRFLPANLPAGFSLTDLDSQYRFLSGWYFGLAVLAWWIIPAIDRHTAVFRIICLAVFLGGLGRLLAWHSTGLPSTRYLIVLGAELLFPLLILWQNKIKR